MFPVLSAVIMFPPCVVCGDNVPCVVCSDNVPCVVYHDKVPCVVCSDNVPCVVCSVPCVVRVIMFPVLSAVFFLLLE